MPKKKEKKQIDPHHCIRITRGQINFDGSRSFNIDVWCELTRRSYRIGWTDNATDAIAYAKKKAKDLNIPYEDNMIQRVDEIVERERVNQERMATQRRDRARENPTFRISSDPVEDDEEF